MKDKYEYRLSYLTKETFEKNVKAIADAMGLESPRHLYAILGEKQTDPYALWRRYFKAIAHVSPEHAQLYLQDLRSLVPSELREKAHSTQFSEGMGRITKHFLLLQTAASGGDAGEVNAELERLHAMCGKLLMDLNPTRPQPVEARRERA